MEFGLAGRKGEFKGEGAIVNSLPRNPARFMRGGRKTKGIKFGRG